MNLSGFFQIKQDRVHEQTSQLQKKQSLLKRRNIFRIDQTIGVSKFRIYLLRFFYLVISVFLGIDVWIEIFTHKEQWLSLPGVAYSFWGAFSILAILGLFHPLKLIPLLLLQFSYKIIWLIIAAYPLWAYNQLIGSSAEGITTLFIKSVVVDVIIIPWPYVLREYILILRK